MVILCLAFQRDWRALSGCDRNACSVLELRYNQRYLESPRHFTGQLFSRSVTSNSLRLHERQHSRLSCPSLSSCLLTLVSIELVTPSNRPILCHPLSSCPVFPSVRVFSSESALPIRWPKDWSFSISPSNEYLGLISFTIGAISLQSKGLSRVFSSTQPSLWYNCHIRNKITGKTIAFN